LEAIKEGIIWRVGNGDDINMWVDPWIPRGTTRRPITPRRNTILTRVSELIDPQTGNWDGELVRDIFWEDDVQHILAIPIKHGREDTIAWHYDPRGMFSVKFAYHVLEDKREQNQHRQTGSSSSSPDHQTDFDWLHLWRIPYAPKVKQFLWRLAHNSLPLRLNIDHRGVEDVDTRCPVCWRLNEDGGHCFLKCKFVKRCWQTMNLEEVRLQLVALKSAKEVVHHVLQMGESERNMVVNFLWVWWDTRNKLNAGEHARPLAEVLYKTMEMASSADQLNLGKKNVPDAIRMEKKKWLPPPADVLKINTDGAFIANEKCGAWGFVIRDSAGQGVLAG
jgi:hypothetical protein